MLTEFKPSSGRSVRLVLAPNQSLSWTGNLYVSISLLIISLFIGVVFTLWGAWVIFPFAILEVMLLLGIFYFINQGLNCQEVVSIDEALIVIEKGSFRPEQSWYFPRGKVVVVVQKHSVDGCQNGILVSGDSGLVQLGEFLSSSDSCQLLARLKSSGLVTRIQGPLVIHPF